MRRLLPSLFLCLGLGTSAAYAGGDATAGAAVFRKCAACHTASEPVNRVGPSLMGVIGRPAASVDGYSYSDAMKAFGAEGHVWDEATLSEYLLSPKAMVGGTKMSFPGLKKPQDIADVIAYLKAPPAAK
ncbi:MULTISPECIES: cytochrome c family protein [unclassified Ensifer]|uniref:c-type cytochrome n=1 Tax=unclassified Ensifer TaxID=2633371 RepID=UPI000813765A|nr:MULTISPECIES: cytochrome c family protein [unclassified Ensifer]OCP09164.1 cytochrome c family protein [Ensifer sp. LC13]OCP10350.1 cytochrome c family protein [Ensifer sp. LC11]OCP14047.1 cytochrome c family protein [Ensifer sp. LC14]OCP32410.1 cytochrome c family protein [Ensifer sp. LC499]